MKIYPTQYPEIIKAYSVDLVPMAHLAKQYNVSRMAIYKILYLNNVDTKKGSATQIKTECAHCHKHIQVVRCQFRNTLNHFCSKPCFYAWLNRSISPFISYRHGLRIARKIVSEYFNLMHWHIVHHEDRNQSNNELSNLRAFESQSDHAQYHRGFTVIPIWDGRFPLQHNNPPIENKYIS